MGIKSRAAKVAATVVLGVGLGITSLVAPAVTPIASANGNYHWHDDHGRNGWCQEFYGVSWDWPPPGWRYGDWIPDGVVAFRATFGDIWTWGAPEGTHPVQLDGNGWVVTIRNW